MPRCCNEGRCRTGFDGRTGPAALGATGVVLGGGGGGGGRIGCSPHARGNVEAALAVAARFGVNIFLGLDDDVDAIGFGPADIGDGSLWIAGL